LPEGENEPDDHIATGVVQNFVERAVEGHEPRTPVGRGCCKVAGAGPVNDLIGCSGHEECGNESDEAPAMMRPCASTRSKYSCALIDPWTSQSTAAVVNPPGASSEANAA
jgi:hypothetical protein